MKLHTENLVKYYGKRRVVNEVSIEVNQGEIVGLLGPNGAGKTTTFYMCIGLVRPDGGRVLLDLGRVVATAEVHVNDQVAGTRVAPPWTVDITDLVKPGGKAVDVIGREVAVPRIRCQFQHRRWSESGRSRASRTAD